MGGGRQGTVGAREGLILLAHEGVRQAERVVRIGERAAGRHHLLEEVDGPVVVLQLEPLPGLLDQMLSADVHASRSEEHTSELQSHSDLVCRLLLEKKKTKDAEKKE